MQILNIKISKETGILFSGQMQKIVSLFLLNFEEHFIVWMRTAGLPTFRKLYGQINEDIVNGTYYLKIDNNYDVTSFDGTKNFVLSTTNSLGGTNYFLAMAYLIVGSICVAFSILFLSIHKRQQNND